jgi:redox-sensitive bicupin YhaK (pirin superfamily)
MTPQAHLAQAATHLDDALEQLTFDRPDLAFGLVDRALTSLLQALAAPTGVHGPPAARVGAVLQRREPALADLLDDLHRLQQRLPDPVTLDALAPLRGHLEGLVFRVSDLLPGMAARAGLVDPGTVYGALVGAREPMAPAARTAADAAPVPTLTPDAQQRLSRRRALQLLAAASTVTLTACARAQEAPRAPAPAPPAGAPAPAPAGVREVTRLQGLNWPTSDPFLFCAYHVDDYPAGNPGLGPAASLAGRPLGQDFEGRDNWRMYHGETIPGFPRHPHRGFETVTVVRTGMLDHADSLGAAARFGDGDVQWLTAGGGIQHAEMFPLLRQDAPNPTEFFQIWLNLPARDKMVPAWFTMLWSEQIPRVTVPDDAGRTTALVLSAGAYGEHRPPPPPPDSWASRVESDLAIWTLRMDAGARFELPAVQPGTERALYVHRGQGVQVADVDVPVMRRVDADGHGPLALAAGPAPVEMLLLQARPIGEPVARRGPFVMNTQAEIQQAYSDYRQTGFGGWTWGDDGPVHGRDRGRFARHPDGRTEEPA